MHLVLRNNEGNNNESINREEVGRDEIGEEEEINSDHINRERRGNNRNNSVNNINIHAWERYSASLQNDTHLSSLRKKLRVFKSLRSLLVSYCALEVTFCILPFCHILREAIKNMLSSFTSTNQALLPFFSRNVIVWVLSFLNSCCNIMVYLEEHLWWTLLLHELCEIFIISLCGYLVRPSLFPLFLSIDELPMPNTRHNISIINRRHVNNILSYGYWNNPGSNSPSGLGWIQRILPIFSRLLSNLTNNLRSPTSVLPSPQRNINENGSTGEGNTEALITQLSLSSTSSSPQRSRVANENSMNEFESRNFTDRAASEENIRNSFTSNPENTEINSTTRENSTALVIFNQYRYFSNPLSYLSTSTQPSRLGPLGSIFGGASRPVPVVDSEYDPDFNFSTPSDVHQANDLGMGRDIHYNYNIQGTSNNSNDFNSYYRHGYPYNSSSSVDYIFTPPPIYLKPTAVSAVIDSYYIESLYLERAREKKRILAEVLLCEKKERVRNIHLRRSGGDSFIDLTEEKDDAKLSGISPQNMVNLDPTDNSASYYQETQDNETQEKFTDYGRTLEIEPSPTPSNLKNFLSPERSTFYHEDLTDLCQYQDEKKRRQIIKAKHCRSRSESRSRSSSGESLSEKESDFFDFGPSDINKIVHSSTSTSTSAIGKSTSTEIDESDSLTRGIVHISENKSLLEISTNSFTDDHSTESEEEALPTRQERTVTNGLDNSLSSTVVPLFNYEDTDITVSNALNSPIDPIMVQQSQHSNFEVQRATSVINSSQGVLIPRFLSSITDIVVWRRPIVQGAANRNLLPRRTTEVAPLSPYLYNNRSSFSSIARAEYAHQQNTVRPPLETNLTMANLDYPRNPRRESFSNNNEIDNNFKDKPKRMHHHHLHEAYINNNVILLRQPRRRFQVAILEKEL